MCETIKPCPHCGGAGLLYQNYSYKIRSYFVFVRCDVCGATGKVYRSDEDAKTVDWNNDPCNDAIAAWNLRTPIQEV